MSRSSPRKTPRADAPTRSSGDALAPAPAIAATLAILALALVHIRALWFVCDDAFISFRYGAHVAYGLGPVYNPGEHVEGFSNFLWMLVSAAMLRAGAEPAVWAPVVSAVAALGALLLVMRAAHVRGVNLLSAGVLLAASPAFAAWATSGLETALYSLLLTAGTLALLALTSLPGREPRAAAFVSGAAFALAALTRPEALLFGALAAAWLAAAVLLRRTSLRACMQWLAIWLGVTAPQLLWRHHFYGAWLPNSFRVKSPGLALAGDGARYVLDAVLALNLAVPFVAALVLLSPGARARLRGATLAPIAAAIVLFLASVTVSGGDFMPLWRFVAPILPLWALAAGLCVATAQRELAARFSPLVARAAVALLLAGLIVPGVLRTQHEQDVWSDGPRASVGLMRQQVREWGEIGRTLHRVAAPDDTLATTAAGVIPYESQLYTIDLLGLNSADLSAFRERDKGMPGHRRLLREDKLWEAAPQFLLGHPMVRPSDRGLDLSLDLESGWREKLNERYQLVAIPLEGLPARRVGCMVRRDVLARVAAQQPR